VVWLSPADFPHGDRLCLTNGRGHLVVYDLHTLKQTSDFYFPSRISANLFSEDGKRLFVLTNDQTAFILDVSGGSVAPASSRNWLANLAVVPHQTRDEVDEAREMSVDKAGASR